MASRARAIQKVRVVRPQVVRIPSRAPAKRRRGGRRRGFGAGGGIRTMMLPAAGAVVGAWIAKSPTGADLPLADALGKKMAIGALMWAAGHFLRMPTLKAMSIGPVSAAIWEWGETGKMSGEGDVEGDDVGDDDE